MGYRRTLGAALWGTFSAGVLVAALGGCALSPTHSFLDPTKVGRFGADAHESGIRRVLTPRDTPPGLAGATEPVPEDLVAVYEDYRLRPGDGLTFTIQDFFAPGQPFSVSVEISPLGEIRIPDLGSIKVSGLTEQEVEQELTARLKEADILPNPSVIAFIQLKRGRVFNIMGAVRAAGPYPITSPDMRLLEAIGMAGDVDPTIREVYIIRQHGDEVATPSPLPMPEPPVDDGWVIPPPVEEYEEPPGEFATAVGLGLQEAGAAQAGEPPDKDELAEVLTDSVQTRPTTTEVEEATEPDFPAIIFDPETGRMMQAEPDMPADEMDVADEPIDEIEEGFEEPFNWDDVEEIALEQRVIAINVPELKAGNPRYNVIVRDRDVINVPTDTGVFYLMGEVNRPGVYAFGGREITIKQALAIAGGFSPLAWPQNCEIIRREGGTDKQFTIPVDLDAVFAGLDDDFYLRDDDIVNVGTSFVAPFLFVIRNSFRFTYGFGFVYDRNFADKDAYSSKINPQTRRDQQRAQSGLPF